MRFSRRTDFIEQPSVFLIVVLLQIQMGCHSQEGDISGPINCTHRALIFQSEEEEAKAALQEQRAGGEIWPGVQRIFLPFMVNYIFCSVLFPLISYLVKFTP